MLVIGVAGAYRTDEVCNMLKKDVDIDNIPTSKMASQENLLL